MNRFRPLCLAVVLAVAAGCGGGTNVRGQQPETSPQTSSPQPSSALVPPSAKPGAMIEAEAVLAFAGLQLPADAQRVEAVDLSGEVPSYRVTMQGDRTVVDRICDQMGGAVRVARDLPASELEALGLSVQPPLGAPKCTSSRPDYPRVQRRVIGVPQDSTMSIAIHVQEFPVR